MPPTEEVLRARPDEHWQVVLQEARRSVNLQVADQQRHSLPMLTVRVAFQMPCYRGPSRRPCEPPPEARSAAVIEMSCLYPVAEAIVAGLAMAGRLPDH
jgi:hypothetical protein